MKLLKDSRMFHILWCSSGYNYFIIFISILNVLNLASEIKYYYLIFVIFCFMYYRAVISSGTEEGDEV